MFSTQLKKLRKSKNLTQTELANILHLSHGAVAMWETNKRQPDNDTLSRLADYFGVSVDYLLGRETPTIPDHTPSEEERRLAEMIAGMTDEEVEELSRFVDYIISKRN